MIKHHHVAVLDFGSQYTQLIVRKVRELGYFAHLFAPEDLDEVGEPGAIILSGGPRSTSEADAPDIDFEKLKSFGVPVLGVCYGMQLLNIKFGGTVHASNRREYGPAALTPQSRTGLYEGLSSSSQVWMSHSFNFSGSRLESRYRPMSFSGVSIPEHCSLGNVLFPTPGMSPSVQSCSGREMKLLNFLVVVVVIVSGWRKTVMYGLSCGFLYNIIVYFYLIYL
jgi:GMP synthase (glutamine-hydrolysing)